MGVFCEILVEQSHVLFFHGTSQLLFRHDGRLDSNTTLDERLEVFGSCSTLFNGKALIFGGRYGFYKQVS